MAAEGVYRFVIMVNYLNICMNIRGKANEI